MFDFTAASEPRSVGSMLRATANLVLALYIALFMSGASNYAGAGTSTDATLFALAFYGIYGLATCLAFMAFTRGFLSYKTLVVSQTIGLIALAPAFLGGGALDGLTKNYLVSIISLCIFPCAARLADRGAILTFAATLTCVLSLICLLDACFLDGLTNTTGRAAGVLVNPNVSALALVLFATASQSGVPLRWRPAFLVLVAGAVMVSFSRSSMLIGLCTLVAAIPAMMKASYPAAFFKQAAIRAIAVAGVVLVVCICALASNKAFSVAASESFGGVRTALAIWQSIQKLENATLAPKPPSSVVREEGVRSSGSAGVTTLSSERQTAPDLGSKVTPQLIAEAEHENSAVARGVVAQRALDEYESGPKTGRGLSYAFSLVPHNSYLLFAVAFGLFGWAIIPALIAGLIIVLPWRTSSPIVVLILVSSFFSHDLYLSVPLVAGVVVLLISVSTSIPMPAVSPDAHKFERLPFVAASAITLGAALLIFAAQYPSRVITFDVAKDVIRPLSGYAYFAVVPPANPKGLTRIEGIAPHGSTAHPSLKATEDGRALGPASTSMDDVVRQGAGRYGYENMWFFFSSTDGSDPTQNNKSYRLTTLQSPHPLFYCVLVILLGWCVSLFTWSRRTKGVGAAS